MYNHGQTISGRKMLRPPLEEEENAKIESVNDTGQVGEE